MTTRWRRSAITIMAMGIAAATLAPTAYAEETGSYLVVFKDGVSASPHDLSIQGRVGATFTSALRGFAVHDLSERQARLLAAHPAVDYVEPDTEVRLQATQTDPIWGLDRIDQRNLPLDKSYTYPNDASDVTAYVIDTGIRTSHAEFEGRATDGYDFVDNDSVAQDCHGHGTHVAGTIGGKTYGVAKKVKLVGLRVFNCEAKSTSAGIIAAVDWVTANGVKPAVVNMSLGTLVGENKALEDAVRNSINAGFTYAVAAGNSGLNACDSSPSGLPEAITVGASDRNDKRSVWLPFSSNYGSCVDIWAPGSDIVSATYDGDTSTGSKGGTSMASPHVAGAAALYLSANPGASNQQVRDALVNNATDGVLTNIGSTSPNKLLFIG